MSDDAPNFVERIVCLANSRKIAGRCVAGKRTGDHSWFRPISDRPGHEISEFDRRYPDGKTAQLLDVIEIPCIEERPHGHQSENVLIDDRFYWEKKGRASWQDILALVDRDADLDGGCLLCSEPTPEHCHRRLVAEYLRSRWGDLEIIHL